MISPNNKSLVYGSCRERAFRPHAMELWDGNGGRVILNSLQMPTHNTGGDGPQTGARAMVETLALDASALTDGDLTALTLAGSNEQLITSDLDSLVSIQAELDEYNPTDVDIGEGGDTLCVTVPSAENIEINTMEIENSKEIIIPECETQLVEFSEDVDMNEVDITTSVVEETPTPVIMETIQGPKIIHVQQSQPQQQFAHASPIIVSGSSSGQPSQSYVVIQSGPGSRVITTNAANQAKKPGQIVGRITGLNVGTSPQFQSMTQALASPQGGNVVQLRPFANSTPIQRPLSAKGPTLTVGNVGVRMIQPQSSTPSRVTKVLLPRQSQGAGGGAGGVSGGQVQHLVAIPVQQKSGQENQQGSEQVVTVGHQTLRIVGGNVVSQDLKTHKKIGEAVESIAMSPVTGAQTVKPKQETVQILQAGQLTGKPAQVTRTINPSQGNQVVNITLQQAQQMGLLSPGKIQQLMPSVQGRGIVVNKTGQGGAVTVLQSNVVKSPTKILPAPATATASVTLTTASPSIRPLPLSPSKVIITRQAPIKQGSLLTSTGQVIRLPASPQTLSTSTGSVQPMTVSGRTMQYVRLVSIPSSSNTTATVTTAPRPKATSVLTLSSPGAQGQIKMIPIAPAAGPRPVLPKSLLARTVANAVPFSQASGSSGVPTATQIGDRNVSNIVVLPPTFLQQVRPQTAQITQIQQSQPQQQQHQIIHIKQENHQPPPQQQLLQIKQEHHQTITAEELLRMKHDEESDPDEDEELDLPLYAEESPHLQTQPVVLRKSPPLMNAKLMTEPILAPASPIKPSSSSRTPAEPNGIRPRKPCNCTKSQCLKMYCDCFANGEFCHMCNCNCCYNNLDHEEDRQRAIKAVLERNPHAFRPKIGKGQVGDGRRHNKGCNCRRSGCLKNYCECYEAKIACSNNCKCIGCRNIEDMGEAAARDFRELTNPGDLRVNPLAGISKKRQLAPLADPAIRTLQDSSMNGFRQPFNFVNQEVVDATCHCLLAQAEKAEKMGVTDEVAERLIIEEFGKCLVQIIGCASRTDDMVT